MSFSEALNEAMNESVSRSRLATAERPSHNVDEEEEDMASGVTDPNYFHIRRRDYWRKVAESDGFDCEDLMELPDGGGLSCYCIGGRVKLRGAVTKLYARLGLHRYNILKGTRFHLLDVVKYNRTNNCVSSYWITLLAQDLASQLKETFQVRVDEKRYHRLDLTVSVARRKGEEVTIKMPFKHHYHGDGVPAGFYRGELPDWPSDDAFNDRKRFYMVNESELPDNDWIHLYLELAVCIDYRLTSQSVLSKLQILKVAIETIEEVEPPNERLKAKCANVYIMFKGLAKAPLGETGKTGEDGEHVERKAIVRRVISERIDYLTLLGGFPIGEEEALTTPVSAEQISMTPPSGE